MPKRITQDRLGQAPTSSNKAEQIRARQKQVTSQGTAVLPSVVTQPVDTMQPSPAAQQLAQMQQQQQRAMYPMTDARSTLVMKPGDVAQAVGVPVRNAADDKGGTQIVKAQHMPALDPTEQAHPGSQAVQPPKIEIIEHNIPSDSRLDSRLILVSKPDSQQAAAFRVLRHHVLECGYPRVIAVSGPMDGCGKTTVAMNLALALAECNRARVLLVDANLRSPRVASILRFVPPVCFAEALATHRKDPFVPWHLVAIPSLGLHVAAINPKREQEKRLDASAFAIGMDRLSMGPYQHIVVDCPSILGNADVNLIQDATDGVLIAARTKQVTIRDIRNAVDQLTPTKILGTALFE